MEVAPLKTVYTAFTSYIATFKCFLLMEEGGSQKENVCKIVWWGERDINIQPEKQFKTFAIVKK